MSDIAQSFRDANRAFRALAEVYARALVPGHRWRDQETGRFVAREVSHAVSHATADTADQSGPERSGAEENRA